jgi:hypothetical protein
MKDDKLSSGGSTAQTKKAYIKPVLSQIRLVAEEAVLSNCKFGSGSSARNDCMYEGDLSCVSTHRS